MEVTVSCGFTIVTILSLLGPARLPDPEGSYRDVVLLPTESDRLTNALFVDV